MTSDIYTIANAAGFWGDQLDAPRRLVEGAQVDVLTLEYLAELTMSILARRRQKDPNQGYATDFIGVMRSLTPALQSQSQLRIVTNAGGVNPMACAAASADVLCEAGQGSTAIAVVSGDEITDRLAELQADGCEFTNLDTGQPLRELSADIVSANVYLGARPIAEAIADGARHVITGRIADASLTVGPAAAHFGWEWDDWDRLAGATVAGHLIECGAQVTGGYSTEWNSVWDMMSIGYPVAEVDADGSCLITKPASGGGEVNRRTVVEQLVYEIGNPSAYLTPDVVADFTTVRVDDLGRDRVRVTGTCGQSATDSYKVSLAYQDGFTGAGQLILSGDNGFQKAMHCASTISGRLDMAGCRPERFCYEVWGGGEWFAFEDTLADKDAVPSHSSDIHRWPSDAEPPLEERGFFVVRMAVRDACREKVERFARELAPLVTSGPAGIAGYTESRSSVRPAFAFWPTLISKEFVKPRVEVRKAIDWRRKS